MTRGELRDAIVGLLPHEKTGGWLDGDWRSDAAHEKAQTYLLESERLYRISQGAPWLIDQKTVDPK